MAARCRQLLAVCAGALAAACAIPSGAAASVTLGQNAPAPGSCTGGSDYAEVQTAVASGPAYAVPAGGGVITSWSAEGDADTDDVLRLRIFRPDGTPHGYVVTAESSDQAIAPNVVNTFPTRIPVRAGDIIGLHVVAGSGPACVFDASSPADLVDEIDPDSASVGSGEAASSPDINARANVSAKLEPDADGDGFGDETQDQCPTDRERQTACQADLWVTQRVSSTSHLTVGDLVTYTTTVNDFGPDAARAVSVTDSLPPGMALVSASGGTCVLATCAIGDLAPGGAATVTVVARAVATGMQSETATATSATADPHPASNSVTTRLRINARFAGVVLRPQTVRPDRHGRVRLAVTCPTSFFTGNCVGADTLMTAGKGRSRKVGHSRLSIPPGKTRKVTIKLSNTALALLRRNRALRVRQTVRAHDWRHVAKTRSARVTLKARG